MNQTSALKKNQRFESIEEPVPQTGLISVIIPVRNESTLLLQTLKELRQSSTQNTIEIIVVDGQSTDNSAELAKTVADKVIKAERAGRAFQMHQGALAASGNILLFLHVDTELPQNWQSDLLKTWTQNKNTGLAAFGLSFNSQNFYYRFMAHMANFRTRWLTGVPHGDQALSVHRDLYFKVGGFPQVALMEEYYLARKLKGHGRLKIIPSKVQTSIRRYQRNGPIYNNIRNLVLITLFYLGISPEKLAKLYR